MLDVEHPIFGFSLEHLVTNNLHYVGRILICDIVETRSVDKGELIWLSKKMENHVCL